MKHSPEPWTTDPYGNYVKDGKRITVCQFGGVMIDYINRQANSKRIVACVNAMEGIDDPKKLRQSWDAVKHLKLDAYEAMKAERDLLEELLLILHKGWSKGATIGPNSLIALTVQNHFNK
jgi:hypothetical protein